MTYANSLNLINPKYLIDLLDLTSELRGSSNELNEASKVTSIETIRCRSICSHFSPKNRTYNEKKVSHFRPLNIHFFQNPTNCNISFKNLTRSRE